MTTNSQRTPPASNELEVSIFGPGYGEAIVLHIGDGKWILVDSCIDPVSRHPASLQYLHNLDVDFRNAVRLIVATHWHDDHVRGISAIFDACTSAKFAISGALDSEPFLKLAGWYIKKRKLMLSSGLDEFSRIFQLLDMRKPQGVRFHSPQLASADKRLYRDQIRIASGTVEVTATALSPSDASLLKAYLAFAELLPQEEGESIKRVAPPSPNHASVVLWIEVGDHKILLGADLERTADLRTGWSVILSDSATVSGRAGVFKVPHHGSENAHHEAVWSELLSERPFAVVVPFSSGRKPLPAPQDVKRLTRLTPNVYATAPAERRRPVRRNKVVQQFVEQVTRSIQSVHHGWGHVRLRQRIGERGPAWSVELFGDAYALSAP